MSCGDQLVCLLDLMTAFMVWSVVLKMALPTFFTQKGRTHCRDAEGVHLRRAETSMISICFLEYLYYWLRLSLRITTVDLECRVTRQTCWYQSSCQKWQHSPSYRERALHICKLDNSELDNSDSSNTLHM